MWLLPAEAALRCLREVHAQVVAPGAAGGSEAAAPPRRRASAASLSALMSSSTRSTSSSGRNFSPAACQAKNISHDYLITQKMFDDSYLTTACYKTSSTQSNSSSSRNFSPAGHSRP